MARASRLTSIPTPTHIWPAALRLVPAALPEPEGYDIKRVLLVPEEIDAALTKIVDSQKIRSVLQRHLSGMYVTGSMRGDHDNRKPDFERLEDVDEVWVMCFRQPKFDQWRLMGRFAAFNAFVGLAFFRRAYLDGQKKYHNFAEQFDARWPNTGTQAIPIHRGTTIDDYLSQPVRDPYAPNVL